MESSVKEALGTNIAADQSEKGKGGLSPKRILGDSQGEES